MKLIAILVLTAVLCVACSQAPDRAEITEVRRLEPEERAAMPVLGEAARMGLEPVGEPPPAEPHIHPPVAETAPGHFDPALLEWDVPEGWQRDEDRPMRLATYVPEGTEGTECAITILSGQAGGVAANLNRWRAQMELPPLSDAEIDALPRWEMLGAEATYISATDTAEKMQLYGVICPVPGGLLFVKMAGPVEEMASEEEHFRAFCLSMRLGDEN